MFNRSHRLIDQMLDLVLKLSGVYVLCHVEQSFGHFDKEGVTTLNLGKVKKDGGANTSETAAKTNIVAALNFVALASRAENPSLLFDLKKPGPTTPHSRH